VYLPHLAAFVGLLAVPPRFEIHKAVQVMRNIIYNKITMNSSKTLQPLISASRSLAALPAAYAGAQTASRRYAGTLANFKIPTVNNEPNVCW
jgi:hypothetical protein